MGVKPGYKQTEVGVIPEGWHCERLGDRSFVTKLAGFEYTLHFDYSKSGPIVAVRALNIKEGKLDLSEVHTIPKSTSEKLPRSRLSKGDLVMSYVGTLGRVAVIPEDNKFHLAPNVAKISVDKPQFSPEFLGQYLNSFRGQRSILEAAASTTQAALSMGNLRLIPVPRPSLAEQCAIAAALNDADTLLGGLDQLIAKKRDVKLAAMQQLLAGETRLPGFCDEWEMKTLGDTCVFENGDRGTNYPSPASFAHSGIPFVNAGHVAEGRINRGLMDRITRQSYDRLGSGKFRSGDILFCLRGSLGKFGVVDPDFGEGAIASSLVIVRTKSGSLRADYLSCYFSSYLCAQMIEKWSGGAAQPNLGAQDLARFVIPLPSLPEQTAIAAVLTDMDTELAALEHQREKICALKQAMMQELLTGKTRFV
jgi:type I restriction enzyme S subunit